MDAVLKSRPFFGGINPWLVGLVCFGILYAPLYWDAMHGLWLREEHAHGSMVLLLALWLAWQQRDQLPVMPPPSAMPALWGWLSVGVGVCLYVLARVINFSIMEFVSQLLVAVGIVFLIGGLRAVRVLWFPLFFLIFMIPLPGVLVDSATGALKQWVSVLAEHILAFGGYPVGRMGAMLVVGQYQLLVADACSGLHSMFTLTAMGILFMYIRARQSLAHNVLMLLSILPIAFAANIFRVMVLVLVTYHMGDEAGQGFLHGTAGVVLMVAALLTLIALDLLLAKIFGAGRPVAHQS